MNRALRWRALARACSAAVLVSWAGFGCGSEDEGGGQSGLSTGGTSGFGSGGVAAGGASGVAGTTTGGAGGTTGGAGGMTGGTAGISGMSGGVGGPVSGGVGGMTGGASGMTGGGDPDGGTVDPDAGGMAGMGGGDGSCCADGDCICREAPTGLTSDNGPYSTDSYSLAGVGCIYYPTDAEPPFAAVAISDGFLGTGGCGFAQTSGWGDFFASHGIVTMIVETGSGDQPPARGRALIDGIDGFKQENANSSSPLFEKLAGRYGTSGFSMGGGGTSYASSTDSSLLSSVAIMPWGPTSDLTVPTLVICGSSDRTASCGTHGRPLYNGIGDSTGKMLITVSSGHAGQPTAGGGDSGAAGLAFTKLYLEGDERWKEVLLSADYDETNIE